MTGLQESENQVSKTILYYIEHPHLIHPFQKYIIEFTISHTVPQGLKDALAHSIAAGSVSGKFSLRREFPLSKHVGVRNTTAGEGC